MKPGPDSDRVLLAHMLDCLGRILEYTQAERVHFEASRLVQDAVIRNLQTLAESSQRLSSEIKGTELQIPWREPAGFRNVIVHGYMGVDLDAVWLVVENDLPALTEAVNRMAAHLGPRTDSAAPAGRPTYPRTLAGCLASGASRSAANAVQPPARRCHDGPAARPPLPAMRPASRHSASRCAPASASTVVPATSTVKSA